MQATTKEKVFFDQHTGTFNRNRKNKDDIEYIRKGALLEELHHMHSATRSEYQQVVLEMLIDKIEAM